MNAPAVSFQNPGIIDMRAVKTFGVSVKETEQPIGYFGTGLKYAIAILLRTGHQVEMWRGLQRHEFSTKPVTVRGEKFEVVTLDGEELGLTTQVGKTWELWQALREIHCNTLDEGGESVPGLAEPCHDYTTFVVRGREFARAFERLDEVVLTAEPLLKVGPLEIYPGRGNHIYYRGVRVYDLNKPSRYTYNVTRKVDLTEDRTLKYTFEALWAVAEGVMLCENDAVLRDVLAAGDAGWESQLDYTSPSAVPGEAFLRVVGQLRTELNNDLNASAKKLHINRTGIDERFRAISLMPTDADALERCIQFCQSIGFEVTRYPIQVAENLGDGTLGMARMKQQEIWLSRHCLLMGDRTISGTLIEEFLHLAHGFEDESRSMQNFLLDLVVTFGERAIAERKAA